MYEDLRGFTQIYHGFITQIYPDLPGFTTDLPGFTWIYSSGSKRKPAPGPDLAAWTTQKKPEQISAKAVDGQKKPEDA